MVWRWDAGNSVGYPALWLKYSACRGCIGIYMKWMKFATAWMIMIILLQLIPLSVSGFGIPVPPVDDDGEEIVLLQRDHLAYVTVLDEEEMEVELFVNVVSLEPGKEVSVAIPMDMPPDSIEVKETTSTEFLKDHRIEDLETIGERQGRTVGHIIDAVDEHPALFFGSLVPLAVRNDSAVLLPTLYGVGTALPVVIFAFVVALGAHSLGRVFDQVTRIERWARRITGVVFVGVGIYLSLVYIFKVL